MSNLKNILILLSLGVSSATAHDDDRWWEDEYPAAQAAAHVAEEEAARVAARVTARAAAEEEAARAAAAEEAARAAAAEEEARAAAAEEEARAAAAEEEAARVAAEEEAAEAADREAEAEQAELQRKVAEILSTTPDATATGVWMNLYQQEVNKVQALEDEITRLREEATRAQGVEREQLNQRIAELNRELNAVIEQLNTRVAELEAIIKEQKEKAQQALSQANNRTAFVAALGVIGTVAALFLAFLYPKQAATATAAAAKLKKR